MTFEKVLKYLRMGLPIKSKVTRTTYKLSTGNVLFSQDKFVREYLLDDEISIKEILGEWEVNIAVEEEKPVTLIEQFKKGCRRLAV